MPLDTLSRRLLAPALILLSGCAALTPALHHPLPDAPTERIELRGVSWRFQGETSVEGETMRFKRLGGSDTNWIPFLQRSHTRLAIEGADGQPALRCEGRGARVKLISLQARKPMQVQCQIGSRWQMALEEDPGRGSFEQAWRGQVRAQGDATLPSWQLLSLHSTSQGSLARLLGFSITGDGRLLAVIDRSGSRPVLTLSQAAGVDRDRLLSASLALALLELPDRP